MSDLWEPVYGGHVLHLWIRRGTRHGLRVWATECGQRKTMGSSNRLKPKKCPKCLKLARKEKVMSAGMCLM